MCRKLFLSAVAICLGEIQAKGRSPVDLSTPHRVRSAKLL